MIFYGFESGSQEILDNIRKGQTIEHNIRAAKLTKKVGIEMFGFFMLGNLGETEETIYQTIKLARKINPKYCQFTITRADPGSYLYNKYIKEINKKNISWSEYYAFPEDETRIPVVGTDVPIKELINFRKLAKISLNRRLLLKNIIKSVLTLDTKQLVKISKVLF